MHIPKLLVVEDDNEVTKNLMDIFNKYAPSLEILTATDAGQALDHLRKQPDAGRPEAMILDLMMPYGSAGNELDGHNDLDCVETGRKLLIRTREDEKNNNWRPIWVSVLTARSVFALEKEILSILSGHGELYAKPADTDILEHRLVVKLGLASKVPDYLIF